MNMTNNIETINFDYNGGYGGYTEVYGNVTGFGNLGGTYSR